MDGIPDVTPGEILLEEFLKPMSLMPATRLSEIIKGRRRITADTALRLSAYFGNSADFWLGIQDEYDLRKERNNIEDELKMIQPAAVTS